MNVLSPPTPDLLRSFTWDPANRLEQATNEGTSEVTDYFYDPFGRRVRKTLMGVTTYFLWDGDRLLVEYDDTGSRKVRYAYAGGFSPVQVAYGSGLGTLYDVHVDLLGAPRMLTDSLKSPKWRAAYEAYGAIHLDGDPDGDLNPSNNVSEFNIRFPGQYYDEETGLHYNRFRYYDPSIGRYISADPIGHLLPGQNLYTYSRNNPLTFIDPFGLDWEYSQSSGNLTHVDNDTGERTPAGTGYSGHGEGVNNPAMEHVPNVGPITQGTYEIGPQQDNVTGSGTKLPGSMRLNRVGDEDPHGRGGFLIHGDNARGDQSASQGCPVFKPEERDAVGKSGDTTLKVVP